MTEPLGRPTTAPNSANALAVRARLDDPLHTVELSGELDVVSCAAALRACASPEHLNLVVDLSDLTFMDCAGYRAVIVATAILQHRGGSLVLTNPVGEPRRLLTLLAELERDR